jgi:hypothetical protein
MMPPCSAFLLASFVVVCLLGSANEVQAAQLVNFAAADTRNYDGSTNGATPAPFTDITWTAKVESLAPQKLNPDCGDAVVYFVRVVSPAVAAKNVHLELNFDRHNQGSCINWAHSGFAAPTGPAIVGPDISSAVHIIQEDGTLAASAPVSVSRAEATPNGGSADYIDGAYWNVEIQLVAPVAGTSIPADTVFYVRVDTVVSCNILPDCSPTTGVLQARFMLANYDTDTVGNILQAGTQTIPSKLHEPLIIDQCETDSDCAARTCFTVKCESCQGFKQCFYTPDPICVDACAEDSDCEHLGGCGICNNSNVCELRQDCCSNDGDCDDLHDCTTDICNVTGSCLHLPVPGCCLEDLDCNDENPCKLPHHCS